MKNHILYSLLFLLFILSSCDDREEWASSLNVAPEITIEGAEDGVLVDRLKYIEVCDNCAEFRYTAQDLNGDIRSIQYSILQGSGRVLQNDEEVGSLGINQTVFYYAPDEYGPHTIEVTVVDAFGETDTDRIELDVFENEPPVPIITARQALDTSPLDYILDASQSTDGDQEYGGFIVNYHYRIALPENDIDINTSRNTINYVFPEPGNYDVFLRVMDSDSVWSDVVNTPIIIN